MAIHPDIRDEAFGFFVEEAPELLQLIETELLNLHQQRSNEQVHNLMRATHTIKGGAANVGLEAIKLLAHQLEDYFRCLYNPEVPIDPTLEQLFLQSYDCLRYPLLEAIAAVDLFDGEAALREAEPVFAQLHERLADYLTDEDHLPTVAEMGIDIAQNIFETDVAQSLARLESLPEDGNLQAGELRAQAEVFEGIAELLNLPGLGEMAKLTLAALDRYGSGHSELFPIALENFRAAYRAVLGGDRQQGGTPSISLRLLAGEGEEAPKPNPSNLEQMAGWFSPGKIEDELEEADSWAEASAGSSVVGVLAGATEAQLDTETDAALEEVFGSPAAIPEPEPDVRRQCCFDDPTPTLIGVEPDPELEGLLASPTLIESEPEPDLEDLFEPPTLMPGEPTSETALWDPMPTLIQGEAELDAQLQHLFDPTPTLIEVKPDPEFEDLFEPPPQIPLDPTPTLIQVEPDGSLEELFSKGSADYSLVPELLEEPLMAPANGQVGAGDLMLSGGTIVPTVDPPPPAGILAAAPGFLLESSPPAPEADATLIEEETVVAVGENPIRSLAAALTTIEQSFDRLPLLAPEQPTSALTAPETPVDKKEVIHPTPLRENNLQVSVRLNLSQLDRISNQLGELAINRNSLSLQNDQLQESLQELRRRFGEFLNIGAQLRTQLNKMLVSPERYVLTRPGVGAALPGRSLRETTTTYPQAFDALELDRYSEIYNLLQDAIEFIQQLDEAVEDVTLFAEQSDRGLEQQRQILTVLRDELMWARMLPLGNVLNRFPRQLKDLSLRYGKTVNLKLVGADVLVDKGVLEKLYDPLLHLVRNAFDHGIEPPQVRQQQGKVADGRIEIRAYHRGSRTVIEIEDDGRGIDLERIRLKAVQTDLLTVEAAKVASSDRLLNLIFEPGFSTAKKVSELSGRGVGLDIVRGQIQSLKGNISVRSQIGVGTVFVLRIPLTLSISKLLLTWTGVSLVALPSDSIEEIVNPHPKDLKHSGEQPFLQWRGQVIPVYSLQNLLPYHCTLPDLTPSLALESVPTPEGWEAPLLVLRQGNQAFALQVERLLTEQELVIKPFSPALPSPGYLYGCTILGDGSPVPVIDGVTLLNQRQGQQKTLPGTSQPPVRRQMSTLPTILIVDDAAAMRQMLTLTLKKAGYQVIQARDGREALEQLHQHPQIQLVICDIEMPVMNGFEFLTHRRQNPTLMQIPIVMLTSRSGEKHRKLALHLGATHYFTKPYIEQQFLSNLKALLEPELVSV